MNNQQQTIWNEVKGEVKKSIGADSFKNWFSSKVWFQKIDGTTLHLNAASNFIKDTILTRYSTLIVNSFNSHGFSIKTVSIEVSNKADPPPGSIEPLNSSNNSSTDDVSILDKRFTFKNFVVGKPNEFAYAAAQRVANHSNGESLPFNPLFLYGGVGLGKTHLMHAIAWSIKEMCPSKKVIYISAERFMYLFIKSLRYKDMMSFKEMFRNVDVLMIDDVQFIGGKETTQEEFFHTFNDLVDNNRQIILSADKSPSDLDGMEERLKSRLGWGLVADIHPTTYELRLGILQSKASHVSIPVPEKVLEFLAFKITSNIRELEGALNRIVAHATLTGAEEISIDVARDVLKDLLRANEKFITIEIIQRKVCEYFGVKLSDLTSARRHKGITLPRHVAMYLSKQLTTKSLPDIGKSFGGKDHATVIHAVKKVKDGIMNDKVLATDVEILTKSLDG